MSFHVIYSFIQFQATLAALQQNAIANQQQLAALQQNVAQLQSLEQHILAQQTSSQNQQHQLQQRVQQILQQKQQLQHQIKQFQQQVNILVFDSIVEIINVLLEKCNFFEGLQFFQNKLSDSALRTNLRNLSIEIQCPSKVPLGGATISEFFHIWLKFFDHIMKY